MDPRKDNTHNTLPSRNDCFGRNLTVDILKYETAKGYLKETKSKDLDHNVVLKCRYCAFKYEMGKGYSRK